MSVKNSILVRTVVFSVQDKIMLYESLGVEL